MRHSENGVCARRGEHIDMERIITERAHARSIDDVESCPARDKQRTEPNGQSNPIERVLNLNESVTVKFI